MKSCSVGNTNALQAAKAPLSVSWSTVPRKLTSSSDAQPGGQLDQRVTLRPVADHPERAWAEFPAVGRQRSDEQVDALLGDEAAGGDEQRRLRRGPRGARRWPRDEGGRQAGQPPADDDLVILDVERADQVVPRGRVVGHEHVDEPRGEAAEGDLEARRAGPADVAVVPLDEGDHLVPPEQLGRGRRTARPGRARR